MQISSRFTMAIHMFACIDTFSDQKMTSDFMAASIGTNPVIVRKILQQLKAAGLIEVARGTGGVTITRPLEQIDRKSTRLNSSHRSQSRMPSSA